MSEIILVEHDEDFPCSDWKGTPAEKDCYLKTHWKEGKTEICALCGWEIEYGANMKQTKETRGGPRKGSGRPKKPDKRITVSVCLDPENLEWLQKFGSGKNQVINDLIKIERTASE
jgi:uncharacterized protein (DUF4415 family)